MAHATSLDTKTIPVQHCISGNGFVDCMQKQGVHAQLGTLLEEDGKANSVIPKENKEAGNCITGWTLSSLRTNP
ncbi:hypothetical protein BEH_25165 (plasmid) [Priestia filamentosa]|uniref:Uncharacterized protein n=1 Tax=Priestia filamentosa TaxID=1402861 RepID=A0A2S1LZN7_9BACI|nr:hypothetical protein BEH_25165 [Priestia filamentosa]